MKCPNCGLLNPDNAERCDCGYDFASRLMKESYLRKSMEEPKQTKLKTRRDVPLVIGAIQMIIGIFFVTYFEGWWTYLVAAFFILTGWAALKTGLFGSDKEIKELTEDMPVSEETERRFMERLGFNKTEPKAPLQPNSDNTFNADDIKKISSNRAILKADAEKMSAEIFVAPQNVLKELKARFSINHEKETTIFFILVAFFIHLHDRVLFARFGGKLRSLYIDYIVSEFHRKFLGDESSSDISQFKGLLNQYQMYFMQYKEIISDSNNLAESLTWNTIKLILDELNATKDFDVFMHLYTILTINIPSFSVNKIKPPFNI